MKSYCRARLAILTLMLLVNSSHATWYATNVEPGSDIVSFDLRWPYWPHGTYFNLWNTKTFPEGGDSYGGVAPYGKGQAGTEQEHASYNPQLVWSFWGSSQYQGDRPKPIYFNEAFYGGTMEGEGAKAGISGYFPFLRHNKWMRMVQRAWPSKDDPDRRGYVGWWVCDVELNQWHCVGILRMPCKVRGFAGIGGFVEATGGDSNTRRVFDRSNGYYRLNGKWYRADTVSTNGPYADDVFTVIEDGAALRFDDNAYKIHKQNNTDPPERKKRVYTVTKQPPEPSAALPSISTVEAERVGREVVVRWSIPDNVPPQFSYKVELFADSKVHGSPIATSEARLPHVHLVKLDTPMEARSARLTITDLYDQVVTREFAIKAVQPQPAQVLPETQLKRLRPGLRFGCFEPTKGETWNQLSQIDSLEPVRKGIVNSFDDTITRGRDKRYAIRYEGYLRVPETGLYVFNPSTCDGSKLYINGTLIADNDGIHSTTTDLYSVALKEGLHTLRLDYFRSDFGMVGWLEYKLRISMSGSGGSLQPLNTSDLLCLDDGETPSISLPYQPSGSKTTNRFSFTPRVQARNQEIHSIEFFRGKYKFGELKSEDLAAGRDSVSIVLPQGENSIKARLWYGNGNVLDSPSVNYQATDVITKPWIKEITGDQGLSQGINTGTDRVSFSGEGSVRVYHPQPVEGDFVWTGHLTDFLHASSEIKLEGRSKMGLFAIDHRNGKLEGKRFGIWDTAAHGIRGLSDDRDLEGSGMNRSVLGDKERWVKIARRGNHFTAWLSSDGKNWRKVIDHFINAASEMYVGVSAWTLPEKNQSLFHATIDKLKLDTPGELPPIQQQQVPLELKSTERIVALIRGGSEDSKETTLYARGNGTEFNLLASEDEGQSWENLSDDLPMPEATAVRSIAVHPTDPSILLAATGYPVNGRLVSALWKTTDKGTSWRMVCNEIDFDGQGPSTFFGESICFNPRDPNQVAAGGESTGLFISEDGGESWEYAGMKGERISTVAYSHVASRLIIGTFSDIAFLNLGLGQPAISTDAPGRLYVASSSGTNLTIKMEKQDFGITDLSFESMYESGNCVYASSTHGIYYSFYLDKFMQRRAGLVSDELYATIDGWPIPASKRNRTLGAPFYSNHSSQLFGASIGYYWSPIWKRFSSDQSDLNRGISSIISHPTDAKKFWICNHDGILITTNGGDTYQRLNARAKSEGHRQTQGP